MLDAAGYPDVVAETCTGPGSEAIFVKEAVMEAQLPLSGFRVLVVEDEYFLAEDLKRVLQASGAEVVGPVSTAQEALRQIGLDGLDAAIIDLNLQDGMAFPVADELRRQNIPFVFATGYDQAAIPPQFADVTRWEKPLDDRQLVADLKQLSAGTLPS